MSIIQSLKRLFDPIEYRRERQELRNKAEARHDDGQPDGPPPELRRCRLCAYEGEGPFCLRCLAETMERIPPQR